MKMISKENTVGLIPPKTITINVGLLFLVQILLMLTAPALHAHQGATGVVKERMDMMDTIGKDMKRIKAMVQRKQPFDADKIADHAESIRLAAKFIKELFPKGSLKHPSEGLPNIWKKWDKFKGIADQLDVEAEKLREVSKNKDQRQILKQFARVGKTCRSCHTDFRKKKTKKK